MRKKYIAALIALMMFFHSFAVFSYEKDNSTNIAYAIFGKEGTTYAINARMPGVAEVNEKSGKSGWMLKAADTKKRYIYVDVNDGFMFSLKDDAVYVEVEYFDEGNNVFLIEYDSQTRIDSHSEYVDMHNTLTWKKHVFFLQDALFSNGLQNADFRITTYSANLGDAGNALIGGVRVWYGDKKSPVEINLTTAVPGNIFLEGEEIEFDVGYRNKVSKESGFTACYRAVNIEGETLWSYEEPVSFASLDEFHKSIKFKIDEFGLHWFRVELIDSEGINYCISDAEFTYITSGRLNPRTGSSTHADMAINDYGHEKELHRILSGAGYGNIRMGWTWAGRYEQVEDIYTTQPHWKEQLELYKEDNVNIIVIASISAEPSIYSGVPGFAQGALTPYYEEKYANMIRQMVRDTKDYAFAYIIGNESNHKEVWTEEQRKPEYYIRRMEIMYNTIKEEYPEAVVVGLAPTMTDMQWIKDVFSLGAGKYMDVATMHPYAAFKTLEESGFINRMQEVRQLADANGCENMPIWITENGWSKARSGLGYIDLYTESQQLVRMNVYCEAYDLAANVVDYLLPAKNTQTQRKQSYSHLHSSPGGTNDVDLPYGACRSYVTIAAWNKNFGGTGTVEKRYDEGNIRAYCFKRNSGDERFIAMWALEGRDNVSFDLGCDTVELMDCYGNSEVIHGIDGKFTFNLDGDTTYAVGNFAKCELLDSQVFVPEVLETTATKGLQKKLSLNAPSVPDGFTVETECFGRSVSKPSVFTGGKADIIYTLEEKPVQPADDYLVGSPGRSQFLNMPLDEIKDYVVLSVLKDGNIYYKMKLPIKEVTPVTVESNMYPYDRAHINNWIAEIKLHNETGMPVEGASLNISSPDKWADVTGALPLSLSPGETTVVKLPVPAMALSENFPLGITVLSKEGAVLAKSQSSFATSCAVYTETPPAIDGSLDDWNDITPISISSDTYHTLIKTEPFNGADDLSAKVWFKWDDDYLYFASRVTDDVHSQPNKDGGTWRADGFQIGFDFLENDTAFSHIMLALADDGYQTLHNFGSEDSSNPKGPVENGEVKYIREGNETVYEAKIPMSYIMPLKDSVSVGDGANASGVIAYSSERYAPENGMILKFSVLINDNDGTGRKGFIQYGNGISESTTAGFAGLYFLK